MGLNANWSSMSSGMDGRSHLLTTIRSASLNSIGVTDGAYRSIVIEARRLIDIRHGSDKGLSPMSWDRALAKGTG